MTIPDYNRDHRVHSLCILWSLLLSGFVIDIKSKNRLLKVCYVPATRTTFLAFFLYFLAVAINSSNEANKAGGACH